MSELFPMEAHAVPGTGNDIAGGKAIEIAERRPGSFVEVCLWSETAKLAKAIAKAAGCNALPAPGRMATAPRHMLLSAGPARYFAIGQTEGLADRLAKAIKPSDGAVTDLTHGRVGLRLAGVAAQRLLQKGLSFDLSSPSFPPGATTTGAIHHMAVTIARIEDETFDLFVMTSLAGSIWDWVTDSAIEYGWHVQPPVT